jgi:hypothetical protein
MSAPRRRWIDMLRRTAGAIVDGAPEEPLAALADAELWAAHDLATRSIDDAGARAERIAAAAARQRGLLDGAAERAGVVAARADGVIAVAARLTESFERLGVVALNAGLEGARVAELQGRALLLLSEEIRANVRRGADFAEQLARVAPEITAEASEVRRQIDRSRADAGEVGQEAAQLSAAAREGSRSLGDFAARLRRATGVDPEVARAVAAAGEHARGLTEALGLISGASAGAPAISALRPVLGRLTRLLGAIDADASDASDAAPGGEGGEGGDGERGGGGGGEP